MNDESALEGIAALSNKSRWEIFWLLVDAERGQKSAGEIGEHLNIAPATLSFHLKELTHAGLLRATRSGSRRLYAAECGMVAQIAAYITNKCDAVKTVDNDKDMPSKSSPDSQLSGREWVG